MQEPQRDALHEARKTSMDRSLPFQPHRNSQIRPGDFWPIILRDRSYAAGRVLQLPSQPGPGARTSFLAGLMDWHGQREPTDEDLVGRRTVEQGSMHTAAFQFNSWAITGWRSLEADNVRPWLFTADATGKWIQDGLSPAMPRLRNDPLQLPTYSGWGMSVIIILAEKHFL